MIRARGPWVAGALLLSACRPSRDVVTPKPPVFAPVGQSKCGVAKSQSEPLIVEWASAARAQLEALARKGTVVVAYQGCEMRVLPHCRAPGAYAFTPTTRKYDVIAMTDADELYANVPVGAAKLEGKLAQAGQLNVSMTIVGRYDASKAFVDRPDLQGECTGATHVVAGLTTGAFKFFAGGTSEAGRGGDGLGAGGGAKSASKTEMLNEDGDEASCATSTASSSAPPEGCAALLRVEVGPLGTPKLQTPQCPPGTSWDGKQCLGTSTALKVPPNPCVNDDYATCSKKCDAGDAGACNSVGYAHHNGEGVPADKVKAASLYRRACDAGSAKGCGNLGLFYLEGWVGFPVDKPKAAALFEKGCQGGSPDACNNLGTLYILGDGGLPKDPAKGHALQELACEANWPIACSNAGAAYEFGQAVPMDKVRAAKLYQRACDGGDGNACWGLGDMTEVGDGGLKKDAARAVKLFERGCERGAAGACGKLARLHRDGDLGVPVDPPKALTLYRRACDGGSALDCNVLGVLHELGEGGLAVDHAQAFAFYRRACDGGWPQGCFNLGALHEHGRSVAASNDAAAVFYQRACDGSLPQGCAAAKRVSKP